MRRAQLAAKGFNTFSGDPIRHEQIAAIERVVKGKEQVPLSVSFQMIKAAIPRVPSEQINKSVNHTRSH